jgi:hypothetical protein
MVVQGSYWTGIRSKFRAIAWTCRFDTHNDLRSAVDALSGTLLNTIYAEGWKNVRLGVVHRAALNPNVRDCGFRERLKQFHLVLLFGKMNQERPLYPWMGKPGPASGSPNPWHISLVRRRIRMPHFCIAKLSLRPKQSVAVEARHPSARQLLLNRSRRRFFQSSWLSDPNSLAEVAIRTASPIQNK